MISFEQAEIFVSAFVETKPRGSFRLGSSSIWAGDDQTRFSLINKRCTDDFFTTTFQKLNPDCTGKQLFLRRTGPS